MIYAHRFSTPFGDMAAGVDAEGVLVRLMLPRTPLIEAFEHAEGKTPVAWEPAPCAPVVEQVQAYLRGERSAFDLPLALRGTPFQRLVWEALQRVPYGTTTSYAALAEMIDRPRAIRAVGRANGQNPLPLVVPCHRVVGADGSLIGYGGGVALKKKLLRLEGALLL